MAQVEQSISCTDCGSRLLDDDEQKFCQNCGKDLTVIQCEKCEHVLPDEQLNFCPFCGEEILRKNR